MNSDQSNPELVSAPNLGYKIKMHEVQTYGQRGAPALVEDFHPNALMQLHTSRTENRSECFDYASVVANDLANVFRMNSQFEHSYRLALGCGEPAPLRDGPLASLQLPLAIPQGDRTANAWTPPSVRTMQEGQTEGEKRRSTSPNYRS